MTTTPLPRGENDLLDNLITKAWAAQGIRLQEDADHILELRKDNHLIARVSQAGVELENVLRVCQDAAREN